MNKPSTFRLCVLFFTLSFLGVTGFRLWQVKKLHSSSFLSTQRSYQLIPPVQALDGKVTKVTGEAEKQPRDQEEAVKVENELVIQEGEQITTNTRGAVSITFPSTLEISLQPQTVLSFLSTDPTHFLTRQDQGTTTYQTDEATVTLSVRALHGLFSISQGRATITVNPDKKVIIFTVQLGNGTVGYINKENKTQIVEVNAGYVLTFDDNNRLVRVE